MSLAIFSQVMTKIVVQWESNMEDSRAESCSANDLNMCANFQYLCLFGNLLCNSQGYFGSLQKKKQGPK